MSEQLNNSYEKILTVEDVALEAAQMQEFKDAVRRARSKLNATTEIRTLLDKKFKNQIAKIPKRKAKLSDQDIVDGLDDTAFQASSNLLVTKEIVLLLWDKK
ncbi:MAG: hypothetical protein HY225_01080 [Candidatus Vogelbacteria bacterium]|nr:hypothetical protein [Candidatus Vogelbacteria bacterium]